MRVCGKDDAVKSCDDEGKPFEECDRPTDGNGRRAILGETAAFQGGSPHGMATESQRNPLVPAVSVAAAPTRLWP
ncbi:hypothetical protein MRX96_041333 [Rhipicephalus microplus]